MKIGVLAYHGDVIEHVRATEGAARKLGLPCQVVEVRESKDLETLAGLIIPGGESTNFYKLMVRDGLLEGIKGIRNIFGTCAGAILLAKGLGNKEEGQITLGLMDIDVDRNAYGRQAESFEDELETELGKMHAVFIRAPRIRKAGPEVRVLSRRKGEIVACEQKSSGSYYLATCFHPELTTTKFHERFLREML
jgi:5'-phosphate synthase pdxT subunit